VNTAQSAIFREGSTHHYFLEYNLRPRWNPLVVAVAVRALVDNGNENVDVMVAFGSEAWMRLAPEEMPANFIPFHPVLGRQDRIAPGTQADVLFWIHGTRHDLNFRHALAINDALRRIATLELELAGFSYLDSRDLSGFIDGTQNPREQEARDAALIATGEPGAGGSFVLTQRWVHDLAKFADIGVEEQQRVIGRTKADSTELSEVPPTAHIRRAEINVDGEELKIYRRSVPYGNVREHGLYFLAFSRNLLLFAMQLDRMFGLSEDGLVDRLTEFSTPVSGSYFFAPSPQALQRMYGRHDHA
jgi:putative iron-dependent peroxidase